MGDCFSIQLPLIERMAIENKFRYEEISVVPELSDSIYCFWNYRSCDINNPANITLIPDPCVNIILDLNNINNAYVAGPIDKPVKFIVPESSKLFGIRFLPGRFTTLSRIPANSILNKIVPFDNEEWKKHKLYINNLQKYDIEGIQNYAEQQLINFSDNNIKKSSNVNILDSIDHIYKNRGNIYVSELARLNYCSIRTLSRKYDSIAGINPKLMCRIIRFQYTMFNYCNSTEASITDLALNNGYYDQSHFSKDFKQFIGVSPSLFSN